MRKQLIKAGILLCVALPGTTVTMFTGCAGDESERRTDQYINDKSVAIRVHAALSENRDYKFSNVNVDVYKGTVQLSGFVNTEVEKSKARDVARNVQGVNDVVDKMAIKAQQKQGDITTPVASGPTDR